MVKKIGNGQNKEFLRERNKNKIEGWDKFIYISVQGTRVTPVVTCKWHKSICGANRENFKYSTTMTPYLIVKWNISLPRFNIWSNKFTESSPGVRGLKWNIFDRSVFRHYFISTSYAIYCLVIVPAHRKPSPLNPLVHAQEKLPWLFVHMALMSHGFLEHSSWSA